ncbi:MAG TPA: flagellar filament capping protein FliD [Bacteroidota bacterium]|nr:flagellar filament capping protein FliD [Bacteroidota bacterium]
MALTSIQQQIVSAGNDYRTSISKPLTALQTQKTQVTARSTTLSTLLTKMQALGTSATALAATDTTSKFLVYTTASSNTAVATATVSNGDSIGDHSLLVTQLAKTDRIVSSQLTSTATDASVAAGAGVKAIKINVNGVDTTVNVTVADGDTNNALMAKIAAAVNGSTTAGITASVVTDTSTTSKLVFTSKQTGSANAITLTDVDPATGLPGGTLLDSIGLGDAVIAGRTASTATTGGYMYAASALDAKFTLDGIDIVRSTNSVSDALSGVVLQLKSTQQLTDAPITLSTGIDKDAIRSNVSNFLSKFNEVNTYIRSQTDVNPDTQTRQILAGDFAYRSLRSSLPAMLGAVVDTVSPGNPNSLAALGISADKTGNLSITDTAKFNAAIDTSSQKVSDVFNSANGIAKKMADLMTTFTKENGILPSAIDSASDRTKYLDNRIKAMQDRITVKVNKYMNDLAKAQSTISALTAQYSQVASYNSSLFSGSY